MLVFQMNLKNKKKKDLQDSLNLIPMINLIFLLLIFFMLTGVITKKEKILVDYPYSIHGNKKEIDLPNYWKGLVDWTTITVNLTPVGSHQDIIVKRFDEEKIYLQSNGGLTVDCLYHIYAERKDCERNISEYEGASPEDYPGDNSQYLQSGKV